MKLLELLLVNPGKEFHVRELARRTGENINSVRRELGKLERVGLLKSRLEANLKYYAVDTACPIYGELVSIFLKTRSVGDVVRDGPGSLGKVKQAFIYGSFARGEAGLKSDIDLFVVGAVDEEALVKKVHALEEKLSREINYALFTEEEFRERKRKGDPFVKNVLKGSRIALVGGEGNERGRAGATGKTQENSH